MHNPDSNAIRGPRERRATARDIAIGLVLGFSLLPAFASTRLTKQPSPDVDGARLERLAAMSDVLSKEVYFARDGADPADATRSTESVQAFVKARAGLVLDDASSRRLADLEARTLRGDRRRLTPDDLAALFTTVALERARDCSDAEIEFAAEALGNSLALGREGTYPAGDTASWNALAVAARVDRAGRLRRALAAEDLGAVAAGRSATRNDVVLRANGSGHMSAEDFVRQTKEFRTLLQQPQLYLEISSRIREAATVGIRKRVGEFAAAMPERWGGAPDRGLTPVQVFLLAYSGVSDDWLEYSTPSLDAVCDRLLGAAANSPGRPTAFGTGGVVFSTPLEMVFDARTAARFLDLAEERSRQ